MRLSSHKTLRPRQQNHTKSHLNESFLHVELTYGVTFVNRQDLIAWGSLKIATNTNCEKLILCSIAF